MKIVTPDAMRKIEDEYINEYGMDSFALMETAVISIMKHVNTRDRNIVVVCGFGNNAGDALGVARHLIVLHKIVKIFICSNGRELSRDCIKNMNILYKMNASIEFIRKTEDLNSLNKSISESDVVIDGLFGTGLSRQLDTYYTDIIKSINTYSKYVLSIDIPSGMNGENGYIMGECVKANKTVALQFYKKCFFCDKAKNYTGDVVVESLGIPKEISEKYDEKVYTSDEITDKILPKRNKYSHKGTFGRTTIAAGSEKYTGAAYIAAQAAVKTGAGLVTLATSKEQVPIMQSKLAEAMICDYEDKYFVEIIKKSNVVACGPGLDSNDSSLKIVEEVITNSECPIVFDADAINVLSAHKELLFGRKEKNIVLTPHPGEMARFCGCSIEDVNNKRIEIAKNTAIETNCIIVLKGYNTVITDGEKIFINTTGSSAMASGGMGDCLTGIVTGLISQGLDPFKASVLGVYIHGFIGDSLSKQMYSVTATDIINKISLYLKEFES